MSKRRRTRADVWYESFYSEGETAGREVHEAEGAFEAQPTGLLDARGNMIFREPERIGFRLKHRE